MSGALLPCFVNRNFPASTNAANSLNPTDAASADDAGTAFPVAAVYNSPVVIVNQPLMAETGAFAGVDADNTIHAVDCCCVKLVAGLVVVGAVSGGLAAATIAAAKAGTMAAACSSATGTGAAAGAVVYGLGGAGFATLYTYCDKVKERLSL